jgi:vitamin B12 transporter
MVMRAFLFWGARGGKVGVKINGRRCDMRKVFLMLSLMILGVLVGFHKAKAQVELKEVVVTATRVPLPEEEIGSSVTVITEEDIKIKGYSTVKDVLKGELGLDVVSTGGPGAQTSVFLRGLESYHTLVLIDGLEMGDPSLMRKQYDFSNLTVDNIQRIEIVRGPQSVLYGSEAIGGVINIITKRGEGKPSLYFGLEGGSYSTFRQFLGTSGEVGKGAFSLNLSHTKTQGFSAAYKGKEKDGWENLSFSGRLDFEPISNISTGMIMKLHRGKTDLDFWSFNDVKNYYVEKEEFFFKPYIKLRLFDDKWEQELSFGASDHKRKYHYPSGSEDSYSGRLYKALWQNNLSLSKWNLLSFGIEYKTEEAQTPEMEKSAYLFSLFAQDLINIKDISFTTIGIRWDKHKEFGDHFTFRGTESVLIKKTQTRIKGSLGTGFRAPSLYELYGPPFLGMPVGNPDLKPEKSIGWDLGFEQAVSNGKINFGLTYFDNRLKNLIQYEWGRGYLNIAKAKSRGIESFIQITPHKDLSLNLNYTYCHTEDNEGNRLLRRPLNKVSSTLNYSFLDKRGNLSLSLSWVDERIDKDWSTSSRRKLDDYFLVNLNSSFKLRKNLELFARIENLLDEKYQEAYGYSTPRFSIYGGIRLSF